jgi:AmmeMemoRadiSam system protein B
MSSGTLGPAVAGTWYPADRRSLAEQVDRFLEAGAELDSNAPRDRSPVVGVVAPHAGFVYSGRTAGAAFAALRGARFETVVVIGPSHYEGFRGIAIPWADRCATPLGTVDVDVETVERFAGIAGARRTDRPFEPEHCLEAEIPFLQRALAPGWRVVPVLIGGATDAATLDGLARDLRDRLRPGTLVVVSSDFTHYGPRFGYVPFPDSEDLPERIRTLDLDAVKRIVDGDRAGFREYVERTGATICGRAAIDLLLGILPEGTPATLVAYDTSGNMTGDWGHSVSYASLLFRGETSAGPGA